MSIAFGKLTKADPHSKLQALIRRNFEQQLEQEVMKELDSCESYSHSSSVFTQNTFLLWDSNQNHEFPKQLLNFGSLGDILTFEMLFEIFTPDEMSYLLTFLPSQLNDLEKINTLKQLFGSQSFHFGNPLDQFQRKCQVGYFTKNRQKCDELDIMIANLKLREFQVSKFKNLYFKDRKRPRRLPSPCSSVESESQKKICLSSEEDSVSTNQSQSSSAPQFIQNQVPMLNLPLQFPSSTQSIFVTTPITQLPQYTSTSLLTNQMTLAYLQARKSIKKIGPSQGLNQNSKLKLESTVPTGQSDRQWLEAYWKQEIDRYKNPLTAYTFSCIDGSKATVAPAAKKLLSGMSSKPRQHELLKNERPPYVTILSLVRDAAARLPKGYGTRADIMNLVKDSQFINENLPDEKMSSIISGALDRLHQSADPCVKYDQEKKIWIYLHHERDQTYPEWQQAVPQQQVKQKKK